MPDINALQVAPRWSLANLLHYSTLLGVSNICMLPFLTLIGAIQVPDEHAFIVWSMVAVNVGLSLACMLHRPVVNAR